MKTRNAIFPLATALLLAAGFSGCVTESARQAQLAAKAKISKADAEKIALARVPNGAVKEGELEEENGALIWSFDITTPGTKDITEVGVNALTGEVVAVAAETSEEQEKEKAEGNETSLLPKFSHPRDITNPYLPLAGLKRDLLEGKEGSKTVRIERTVLPEKRKRFKLGGENVEALVMEDREFEDGKLTEVTLDYIAQADDGTVYYLGEDVDEYQNGRVTGHSGAWLYGVHTQRPGVLMPGRPKVGDKFKSEDVPKITWEVDEVLSVSETVTVPAGTYQNCLKVKEILSDGATEYKYYAPGVGCIRELPEGGDVPLKSHETRN